jgi:hypothetical protein
MEMAHWFQMGGWWMYPILAAALALGPLSPLVLIAAALVPSPGRRIVGWIAAAGVAAGLAVAAFGVLGMIDGTSKVNAALAVVDPEYVDEIREVGMAEAQVPAMFGLGVGLPVALAMGVAMALGFRPAPEGTG